MSEISSTMAGTVWKITKAIGDHVVAGETIVILESMKMEIPIEAEVDGRVAQIAVEEGQAVDEGQVLAVLE